MISSVKHNRQIYTSYWESVGTVNSWPSLVLITYLRKKIVVNYLWWNFSSFRRFRPRAGTTNVIQHGRGFGCCYIISIVKVYYTLLLLLFYYYITTRSYSHIVWRLWCRASGSSGSDRNMSRHVKHLIFLWLNYEMTAVIFDISFFQ